MWWDYGERALETGKHAVVMMVHLRVGLRGLNGPVARRTCRRAESVGRQLQDRSALGVTPLPQA